MILSFEILLRNEKIIYKKYFSHGSFVIIKNKNVQEVEGRKSLELGQTMGGLIKRGFFEAEAPRSLGLNRLRFLFRFSISLHAG